jgi:hypothetical protein
MQQVMKFFWKRWRRATTGTRPRPAQAPAVERVNQSRVFSLLLPGWFDRPRRR